MLSPIHHTFAPLASWRTCLQAKILMLQPWKWKRGKATETFRAALEQRCRGKATLFASGREALLAILKTIDLRTGEEVILQGYTCAVVANAIHAAGGIPVYADIDHETLNLNLESVEQLISNRTRAIICQHTFGIPADTLGLRGLCDQHNLLLIEDCAHILPDADGPSQIGNHGDMVFFSFGRDKAISGVTGGAVVSKCTITNYTVKIARLEQQATNLSLSTICRLLLYPCLYVIARPLYGIGIGKVLLWLAGKLHLLLPVLTHEEKQGRMAPQLHRIPNACAALALRQLQDLEQINNHRRKLTALYLKTTKERSWEYPNAITEDLPLQKFPLYIPKADDVRAQLKTKNIYLDDGWTGAVVCPRTTDQEKMNYDAGSSLTAEEVSSTILTIPTHPGTTEKQALQLLKLLPPSIGSTEKNVYHVQTSCR